LSVAGTLDRQSVKAESKRLGLAFMRTKVQVLFDFLVGFWIFTGCLVFVEPSPYEVSFLLVLPVAFMAGMGIYRSTLGLLVLFVAFIPFALISAFQAQVLDTMDEIIFVIVTAFLILTSYFAANYVAEQTVRRMRLVMNAYTGAALISAVIGTLAYLGLMPSADTFLLYGRAKAMFNDPNVFGPFLILPAMYALQRILLGTGRKAFWAAVVYMVLFVGVFASFSRAAWGHFAFSSMIVLVLCFWLEARAHEKVRIIMMSLLGAGMLAVALVGLLSIPSVSKLFETRAAGQEYDSGSTGRFGRQGYAWELAIDHPLGIGPREFSYLRVTELPHNVYVNVLHAYGWGGGAVYYLLVILTLWRGIASLTKPSPFRPMMIPLVATFTMVVGESAIIDSDHWRHYYLLVGLIWGISTAIANSDRSRNQQRGELI
jgi:hypothetical protein